MDLEWLKAQNPLECHCENSVRDGEALDKVERRGEHGDRTNRENQKSVMIGLWGGDQD